MSNSLLGQFQIDIKVDEDGATETKIKVNGAAALVTPLAAEAVAKAFHNMDKGNGNCNASLLLIGELKKHMR